MKVNVTQRPTAKQTQKEDWTAYPTWLYKLLLGGSILAILTLFWLVGSCGYQLGKNSSPTTPPPQPTSEEVEPDVSQETPSIPDRSFRYHKKRSDQDYEEEVIVIINDP